MPEFNAVENTLFIPMLGRIYASEHFQNILYDEKALELLIRKLELRGALEAAYDQDDRIALRQIAVSMVPATIAAMQEFDASFRRQWLDCGKVFGLEVIQRRNAGLIARLEETALRIREYLDDRISAIDELDARPSVTFICSAEAAPETGFTVSQSSESPPT